MTTLFWQTCLAGLSAGAIYALIALALSMIYQAIHHINFAQGEMAMLSTFLAWQMLAWGAPYALAFAATVALSFLGGAAVERLAVAPIRHAPALSHLVVFVALIALFNGAAGALWDRTIKPFPSPFGHGSLTGAGLISAHDAGMALVAVATLLMMAGLLRGTRVGLAIRAAAENPEEARLLGLSVARLSALGWGLAAAIGAVAGMLIAHKVFLEPNMMLAILVYGLAGAVLGGLESPGGAVLGGFLIGLIEALAGAYAPYGSEIKLPLALGVIVLGLLLRPAGLFGRRRVARV